MAKSNSRPDGKPMTDTMQLNDPVEDFEPIYKGQPEEYEPTELDENVIGIIYPEGSQPEQRYSKAERVLTVMTGVLSALLILGSLVFWWYFVSRLSICAISINNYRLYQAMLVGCAVIPLVTTVVQAVRRTRISAESWMLNMCVSGLITAIVMVIYNMAALGNGFAFNDALTILCFSISGCALPAAVYTVVRYLIDRLCGWVRDSASLDRQTVYADVQAQCEGRF